MQIPAKDISDAKSLCTAVELRLIESSHGAALEKTDQSRLKKKIVLARELRDKWRDLYAKQRRDIQQEKGGRASEGNQRSNRKSELFANALARFEAQLARVVESPAALVKSKSAATSPPPKVDRVRVQRVKRARTKQELKALQQPSAPAKQPARPAIKPGIVTTNTATKTKKATKKVAKAAPRKIVKKSKTASIAPVSTKRPANTVVRTKGAIAAAKSTRIKVSGKDSRVRGHVSASGKRSQARRDAKRSSK